MSTTSLSLLLKYLKATLTPDDMRWMVNQLAEQVDLQDENLKPYTIEELHQMVAEGEHQIAEGKWQDSEDMFRELEEEFAAEEPQYAEAV